MTVVTSTLLGRPLWYELMTTDMTAAERFYRTVVGWSASPFEGSPQPYTMFSRSGNVPVAGLMTTPEGVNAPPFWAMYVGAPKLEEAVARVKQLGGVSASPVFADGRMYFLDEDGRTTVIRAGAAFERLAVNAIDGPTLASMAVASGSLFIRSATHLYRIAAPRGE